MEERFDLATAVQVARRRAWIVLLCLAAALAAAFGVTRLISPEYEATATLFVGASARGDVGDSVQYAVLAQGLVSSYAALGQTRATAELAAQDGKLALSNILGRTSIGFQPGTQILTLRARAGSAPLAARVANALAQALAGRVSILSGSGSREVGVRLIDKATAPASAVSPSLQLNLILGGLAGLLVGLSLAFGRERLDGRLRTAEQTEQELGLPVLGVVPSVKRKTRRADALARHSAEAVAEPYRSLAVTLASLVARKNQRRILITSARAEDGKTTVAAHLALALAEDRRSTALIEGDLRRPTLRRHFPAPDAPTLDDVLYRTVDWRLPKSSVVCSGLKVIAAGESHADASLVLRAPEFEQMLAAAQADNDQVLIDAPPALQVSDTSVLARHADTVLLVVRAGVSRADDVRATRAAFKRLGIDIAGIVLTGASSSTRTHYYGRGPTRLAALTQLQSHSEVNGR